MSRVETADPRAERDIQLLDTLRSKRSHFESQWEEVAWRLVPAHVNSFLSRGLANALSPGRPNTQKSYDATAALALQRFASVFESITTPQGQRWHRLKPAAEELKNHRPTRLYLDKLADLLFKFRYAYPAGFVGQQQKTLGGYGAYGNGLQFTDAMDDRSGLRYRNLHLGETFIVENHQGVIDTMFRDYYMSIRQMAQQFGKENLPDGLQRRMNDPKQLESEENVLHVVKPRGDDRDPRRLDALGMAFESTYYHRPTRMVLREGGYRTFPLSVARYMQFTNETYGRGIAQTVLPAIKVLDEEKKTVIRQGHRAVDPVLLTHDDGTVGSFSLRPGAINPGGVTPDGRPLVHVLPTGNYAVGKDMMDDERQVINDAFLITLFQILIETPAMTATEVLERAKEKGMLIAPTAGRFEQEYLGPMITRELDVLEQLGLLPPPPGRLLDQGGGFEVEYENPMARMVRAENAAGFMRALDSALNIMQITQNPEPLDWFNFDVAMPAIQDISGAPTSWTNTQEQVTVIRKARRKELEDAKAIQAAPAMAAMAKVEQDKN